MATATVSFNIEGDAAAVDFHGRRPDDIPSDAINRALYTLYEHTSANPYVYLVYDGDRLLGLLVAGNFNPNPDDPSGEIRAIWDDIVFQNRSAPLGGDLAPVQIQS